MSTAARAGWERLGELAALPVVAGTYVVLFPVVLLLDDPVRVVAGSVVVAVVALYCLAHAGAGWGVFFLAGVPALTSTVLDDVFAWPRWIALCFCPFAIALAWFQDHPDEPDEPVVSPREPG